MIEFSEERIQDYVNYTVCLIALTLYNGLLLYFLIFRDYVLSDMARALLIDIALLSPILFFSRKISKLYIIFVFILAFISSLINVLHIVFYRNFISFWAIQAIFETTGKEAKEFTSDFFSFKLICSWLFSLILPYICFKSVKRYSKKLSKKMIFPYIVTIFSLIILIVSLSKGKKFYNSHYLCLNLWSLNKYFGEEKVIEIPSYEKITYDLGNLNSRFDKINLVVIVGEAANRNHMSCYGYLRNTTPKINELLKKDENFLKFCDVISSATHTVPALKNSLMFTNKQFDKPYVSIIDVLNNCNFKTFWFSNQTAATTSGNVLEQITSQADVRKYVNYADRERSSVHFDEELLPLLKNALQDTCQKKAIFLHVLGSHLTYSMRYPKSWSTFTDESLPEKKQILDTKYKTHINAYDNSVLYNDYVVAEILKTCISSNSPTVFCYFSDHGQEVYDCRLIRGCDADNPTKNMVEIPFFVWGSENYINNDNEKWSKLKKNINLPYSTFSLSNSLLQLAGIRSRKIDSMASIFNMDEYTSERKVFDFSYAKILQRNK